MFGLLVSFLVFSSVTENNHPSHFSYAEIEYNSNENIFEASLEITGHDLSYYFRDQQFDIENIKTVDSLKDRMEDELNLHFYVEDELRMYRSSFIIEEVEQRRDDTIIFYMSSEGPQNSLESIYLTFDLFMESFPNQENKISFIQNNKEQTYLFNQLIKGQWISVN